MAFSEDRGLGFGGQDLALKLQEFRAKVARQTCSPQRV